MVRWKVTPLLGPPIPPGWPLRAWGVDVTRSTLFVIDGAKALRAAVVQVFDHPVIARSQLHRLRNVEDRSPTS